MYVFVLFGQTCHKIKFERNSMNTNNFMSTEKTKITLKDWNYWYDLVYAFFYRRLNNQTDVEDLTADVLSTFFLKEERPDNDISYLWGIAKKKFLKFLEQKNKNKLLNYEDLEDFEYAQNSAYKYKIEALKECLKKQTSDLDQKIINACILENFGSQEVSQKLNLSPDNIRQRLSRSLSKLRTKCKELWFEN
jgi:RNA polymerase sigma factor (sigma-70 family)